MSAASVQIAARAPTARDARRERAARCRSRRRSTQRCGRTGSSRSPAASRAGGRRGGAGGPRAWSCDTSRIRRRARTPGRRRAASVWRSRRRPRRTAAMIGSTTPPPMIEPTSDASVSPPERCSARKPASQSSSLATACTGTRTRVTSSPARIDRHAIAAKREKDAHDVRPDRVPLTGQAREPPAEETGLTVEDREVEQAAAGPRRRAARTSGLVSGQRLCRHDEGIVSLLISSETREPARYHFGNFRQCPFS